MAGAAAACGAPEDPGAAVAAALDALAPPGRLGLAVSGGGDSVALMIAAAEWARARGRTAAVAVVDHGLRPAAAQEAAAVVARAAALGVPAQVLVWRDPPPAGAGQAQARAARTALLADWARGAGLAAVATGHTLDDQAETVLMRLARGAGVDGLSAIAPAARRAETLWIRPLLGLPRAALRAWLRARDEPWVEDPSNDDPRFARTAARRALAALAPLGVDAAGLARTAARLGEARAALDASAAALWRTAGSDCGLGVLRVDAAALADAPAEVARRLLSAAARHIAGAAYAPPAAALAAAARAPAPRALGGCLLWRRDGALTICREPAAAARARWTPDDGVWDGRWRLCREADGAVRAVGGAGEAALAAARREGRWRAPSAWAAAPRPARLAAPALWRDGRLVCAPAAGFGVGLSAAAAPFRPGAADVES